MQPHKYRPPLTVLAILWVIGSLILGVGTFIMLAQPGTPVAANTAAPTSGESTSSPTAGYPANPTNNPASNTIPVAGSVLSAGFGYGIQMNGLVGDPAYSMGLVQQLGMTWVKQQVRWADFSPAPNQINWGVLDGVVDEANKRGIKVMLSVVTAPAWSRAAGDTNGPPDDLNQYAVFVGQVVDHYKGKIQAIEVWNEQNLRREWNTGQLSASQYTAMLKAAYVAIKSRDPNIIVISGGLSPTGVDDGVNAVDDFKYLQQMIDAGFLNYADCVGAHHNGYNIGPDVTAEQAPNDPKAKTATFRGPFDSPHHSWSFKSTLQGYNQILKGARKLCVTEFGWASSQGLGGYPSGFEFANDNTLQEQADYIVQAFTLMRQWGFVRLAFLWNLDYGNKGNGPTDNNVPYSLLDTKGIARPAFQALQQMPKP